MTNAGSCKRDSKSLLINYSPILCSLSQDHFRFRYSEHRKSNKENYCRQGGLENTYQTKENFISISFGWNKLTSS